MAGTVSVELRNQLVRRFREAVCQKLEVVPFPHQREWWAASEGLTLVKGQVDDFEGQTVQLPDGSVQRWHTIPRLGGCARFIADLGAFKIGKSFGAALWLAGFAPVPDGRISLVALEYDVAEPEFNYLVEFLLSERGMGMKAASLQNRPRDGKMWLELENGCRYEAKSWERKDTLKGKEIDAYCFCEAFMLPGIECLTANSQNLRARRGYAIFPTTPDRPWVKELHNLGHGEDEEWHCTCSVGAEVNPFTFDARSKVRDQKLMTREKFAIHYEGKLGDFVGRVFNFSRGSMLIPGEIEKEIEEDGIPEGWEVVTAADTGTFYTALAVAFSPAGDAYVLEEFPNYRYVAGLPERDEGITIPVWAERFTRWCSLRGAASAPWADKNSQFKKELINYGITLLPATVPLETRTEIAREYFQHSRIYLSHRLEILPFEIENAQWPEEATAAGKFSRAKDRDHTLDCLEHILSKRPIGRIIEREKPKGSWLNRFKSENPKATWKHQIRNPHLGGQ